MCAVFWPRSRGSLGTNPGHRRRALLFTDGVVREGLPAGPAELSPIEPGSTQSLVAGVDKGSQEVRHGTGP
jgi:hypothetical protein